MLRTHKGTSAPESRSLLYAIAALLSSALVAAVCGEVDVIATAGGKLVPSSLLKVVQPADAGVVRDIAVREGAIVAVGQSLFRLDTRLSDADRRILDNELALRRLQLRRIDAELAGTNFVQQTGDLPAQFVQVHSQYVARRRAFQDAVETERSVLAKATQDLRAAEEIESKLRRIAPIYRAQEQAWDQLAREGYAGKLMAMDRSRNRIENEQDLQAQAAAVVAARAAITSSERRIAQLDSQYRREAATERVEIQAQVDRLHEDLAKATHRNEQLELRAPVGGVVKDLATHTVGTVVAPGTILATIVPSEGPLEAEVWIDNLDAGRVSSGMAVHLKVAAYPYQTHGTVRGTVRHVSADATERSDPSAPGNSPLYYRAIVSLDRGYPGNGQAPLRLVPGMQVTAELHLGRRTVMDYLLSPLRRVVHEAAREP